MWTYFSLHCTYSLQDSALLAIDYSINSLGSVSQSKLSCFTERTDFKENNVTKTS